MDSETARTLITAVSSSIAVISTALFGYFTHTRKNKIASLEKRLSSAYGQFITLYRVEKEYLTALSTHLDKSPDALKIIFRRRVVDDGNVPIELTDSSAYKAMVKL